MLEVPSLPNAEIQADWAEMSVLFSGGNTISRSDFETALEESGHSNPDYILGNIWQEVGWRQSTLPELHPIYVTQSSLIKKLQWHQSLPYSFMLLLARNYFYESTKLNRYTRSLPSKLFERLVSVSLKEYLGRSLNIGWPRKGIFKQKTFKESIIYFTNLSNEDISIPIRTRRKAKDEGADVIAWRPIDQRSGQAIIVAQCTIEKNWHNSVGKVNLDTWQNIVDFAIKPMKALAFPAVYHDQWNFWSKQGGILLDRLRLSLLFPKNSAYLYASLKNWSENQIVNLQKFD